MLDNLGWVFVLENGLFGSRKHGKLDRKDIGLFNKNTQSHLPENLRTCLRTDPISAWYSTYTKNYRDAVAHRIPLYLPPADLDSEEAEKYIALEAQMAALDTSNTETLNTYKQLLDEQQRLGQPSLTFQHCCREENGAMLLHAQVINDYVTIEEIIYSFCRNIAKA
jgi:hypothetical protein